MNFDNLKTMKREQLVELAGKQGLNVHHKAKPETIIKQIMDHVLVSQKPQVAADPMVDPRLAAKRPEHNNTPEQVDAILAPIKARVPEFEVKYDLEENTWHFRCKGAEECGNLSIPLRIIKMKADTVSRGRLVLMGLTPHFDTMNSALGKNAYTNTVLA